MIKRVILCVAALFAAPVSAMELADCASDMAAVQAVFGGSGDDPLEITDDGWCRAKAAGSDVGSVEWQTQKFDENFSVEVRVTSVKISDTRRLDFAADIHFDFPTKTLSFEQIRLVDGTQSELNASFNFGDMDLSSTANAQVSMGAAKLTQFLFRLESRDGLLDETLAQIVRGDPEMERKNLADAGRARDELALILADVPEEMMSQSSRSELGQLIRSYPNAQGVLSVEFTPSMPLGLGPIMGFVLLGGEVEGLAATLSAIDVDWQPGR